jgi:transposase
MTASSPRRVRLDDLVCVYPNAAGLDIGSEEIVAAVLPDRDPHPVRAFRTFTPDLQALVAWLQTCGIDTVAMESTGVFWIPIYDLLEQHGITPYLVNAQHVKTVPGRKSDWSDAQWLQKLHMLGLLQGSFRPDAEIRALRTLVRHRADLIQHRAPHILHMQQALKQMNIQLSVVLTDIMGTTGQAIIRAIVAGERDPVTLARLRHPACHSSEETIARALTGTWQAEHLFVLKQALALFDFYTKQIRACDAQIEAHLRTMQPRYPSDTPPPEVPPAKPNSRSRNQPAFHARGEFIRITGVDLVAVTGLAAATVQTILSEVGTDMTRFPSSKRFCSWLGVAPHNDISGGKVLRSRTMKVVNRAGQAFRQAAQSVARSNSVFGAYFRSMRARLGPQQAIVATAHKIARVFYHLLKYREAFTPECMDVYEQRRREREIKHLMRRANRLGYALTPVLPSEAGPPPKPSEAGVA